MKLPVPGQIGAPADELHMLAAAQHVRRFPDTEYTAAYLDLASRGAELPEEKASDEKE